MFLPPAPDSHRRYILCCLARMYSKIRAFHLFIGQPRFTGIQPCLDNSTSRPRLTLTLFTSVSNPHPILIMGQGAWKDLSVCLLPFLFGFHGCASWLHKKNKIGRKTNFVSPQFFSGKIPAAPGNVLHTGVTKVLRLQSGMYAHAMVFLYCRYCTAGDMNVTCPHLLCNFLHKVINRGGQGHK